MAWNYLLNDFCSINVITGTHHTGPLRKLTKESNTQESACSSTDKSFLTLELPELPPFLDIVDSHLINLIRIIIQNVTHIRIIDSQYRFKVEG